MTVAALLFSLAPAARAQGWRRFDVAPETLVPAVRGAGAAYERTWNDLLVAQLRARAAKADSAERLAALARRVADAEPVALGSHVGADALTLARRWNARQRDARVRAAVAESLGVALQATGRVAESESALREALQLFASLGERRREAWLWGTLGTGRFNTGDYPAADSLYRRALAARRAIGDSSLAARALNTLGSVALERGRYPEALAWFAEARRVRTTLGERGPLAATLSYMSEAARRTGRADSARTWLAQALELATAAGDSARVADVAVHLADVRADEGDAAAANALAERAVAIAAPARLVRTVAGARHAQGKALARTGRFTDAARQLDEAATLARGAGDVRALAEVLVSLGDARLALRETRSAREALREADSLGAALGAPALRARARIDLGIARRLEGDASGAVRDGEAALAGAVELGDSVLVLHAATSLGELAWDRGDAAGARAWFARAAEALGDSGSAESIGSRNNLAILDDHAGRYAAAESGFRSAYDHARAAGLPEHAWHSQLGLGDVAERRGDVPAALDAYRAAVATIDSLRGEQHDAGGAIGFFANRLFAYEALVHLLGTLDSREPGHGHGDEAFLWAERARGRSLLDLMRAAGRSEAPESPVSLERARMLVPGADAALLVFSTGDSSSTGWLVRRGGATRFTLPPARVLRLRVEALRRALATPGGADEPRVRESSRALAALLLGPALAASPAPRRLVIVPDGALALLPFGALELPARPGGPRWAIERFDLAYAPSVSALAALPRAPVPPSAGILAVANPDFGAGSRLAPLPATARELVALSALAPPRPFASLEGAHATRSAVLAQMSFASGGIVHLATHGTADAIDPARSGLWFAAEEGEPRLLSAADVAALHLSAGLVTLSACESGLGRLERGEGVLGLPRAFLAAGATSVVVSLWSVPDAPTATLMSRFYERLLRGGAARDHALADAQRALLRDPATRDPSTWAPFVLVGASGPLAR